MPPSAIDLIKPVPIDLIRPGSQQARRQFNAGALQELAESIRESGIVQPLVLRTRVWGYELLAGERRWRAAQLAGLHQVPAIVRDDLSDAEAHVLGLIENLQRESLSPMETSAGLKRLGELYDLTHEELGRRIGKSREYVSNFLRLINLVAPVAALVDEGHLHLGHAKVLASLTPEDQLRWADASIRHKLTVRALERRVSAERQREKLQRHPHKTGDWQRLERELSEQLGYPVAISAEKSGQGELRVRFHSLDELDGLLQRIGYEAR